MDSQTVWYLFPSHLWILEWLRHFPVRYLIDQVKYFSTYIDDYYFACDMTYVFLFPHSLLSALQVFALLHSYPCNHWFLNILSRDCHLVTL